MNQPIIDPIDAPEVLTVCPRCKKLTQVNEEPEAGVPFEGNPLCILCKFAEIDFQSMDGFDREYARLRANGWAD